MRGARIAVAAAIAVFVLAGKVRGNAIRTVSDMGLLHRARTVKPLQVTSRTCDNGFSCSPPKDCCPQGQGCCYLGVQVHSGAPYLPSGHGPANVLSAVFWNHWFFWSMLALLLLSCSGGCSLWRRRHELDPLCCGSCGQSEDQGAQSDRDSTASCYPPPQYSRCNSFSQPPPYSEVTSKPDLYPLVISYNDNSAKGGSYLMVQYLRHYFLRPAGGSLSHTSTAESLSSNFVCGGATATALAGTVSPPRYVSVADSAPVPPTPPPLPSFALPPPLVLPAAPLVPAWAARRALPLSASVPSMCSLLSSRCSSTTASRTGSRTASRSQTQSYAHSMVVGEWSNSGSVSVSVQAVRAAGSGAPAGPLRPTSLPQPHAGPQSCAGCSGTVSEVSSLLGEESPSSPPRALSPSAPRELRLLLEQIDSLAGARPAVHGRPGGPWQGRRGWIRTVRSAPCTPMSPVGPASLSAGLVQPQPAVFQPQQSDDPPSPAPADSTPLPPPPRRTPSVSGLASCSGASRRRHLDQQARTPLLRPDPDDTDPL